LWFGGQSQIVLRRTGRLADGWFPYYPYFSEQQVRADLEVVRQSAREAGRDPASVGVEGAIYFAQELDGKLANKVNTLKGSDPTRARALASWRGPAGKWLRAARCGRWPAPRTLRSVRARSAGAVRGRRSSADAERMGDGRRAI
jgi:alkanesulfonate monooxygenase SsuD/methylene tetrahydromethanopterin reductase-like flavin-dependent oxidoreductase (luciferase family)